MWHGQTSLRENRSEIREFKIAAQLALKNKLVRAAWVAMDSRVIFIFAIESGRIISIDLAADRAKAARIEPDIIGKLKICLAEAWRR